MKEKNIQTNESELDELVTLLNMIIEGTIIITYDNHETLDDAYTKLKNRLSQRGTTIKMIYSGYGESELEESIMDTHSNTSKENLMNQNKNILSTNWDLEFLQKTNEEFNVKRDFYMEDSDKIILIWIKYDLLKYIINKTPDFWRAKTGIFNFFNNKLINNYKQFSEIIAPNHITKDVKTVIIGYNELLKKYHNEENWNKVDEINTRAKKMIELADSNNEEYEEMIIDEFNMVAVELIEQERSELGLVLHELCKTRCKEDDPKLELYKKEDNFVIKKQFKMKIGTYYYNVGNALQTISKWYDAMKIYGELLRFSDQCEDMQALENIYRENKVCLNQYNMNLT